MLSGNNTHSTPSGPIAHIGEGGTGYGTNTATTNTATTAATAAKASGYNNYNANYSNGSYSNGSYNGGYSNYGSYNNRYSNYERQQLRHQYGNDGNDGSYNDNGYGNNGRTTAANQHSKWLIDCPHLLRGVIIGRKKLDGMNRCFFFSVFLLSSSLLNRPYLCVLSMLFRPYSGWNVTFDLWIMAFYDVTTYCWDEAS